MQHDRSYKDQNELEQHMGLSQDMMVSNVLGSGPSGARDMNGAPGPRAWSPNGSAHFVNSYHSDVHHHNEDNHHISTT